MKTVPPVIGSIGVPYLQMALVGSHSTLGREKKRKVRKEGVGGREGVEIHSICHSNCTQLPSSACALLQSQECMINVHEIKTEVVSNTN